MRREWAFYALAGAMACLVGAAAVMSPLIACIAVVLVLGAVAVTLEPWKVVCLLAFLTAAFPKAGVKVADFPFPVFLFILPLAMLLLPKAAGVRPLAQSPAVLAGYLALVGWMLWRANEIFATGGFGGAATILAWTIGPVTILLLATRVNLPDRRFQRAFERGFLFAAAFALVQLAAGIEQTAIPGLTIAFGDSYEDKHNGITSSTGVDYSKIMSTYQGGNIFGIAAMVFFLLAAQRIIKREATRHDWILAGAGAMSIGLSGSRTAIVGAVVGIAVLYALGGSIGRKLALLGFVGAAGWFVLLLVPGLAERYTISNVVASGGAGRTEIWRRAFEVTTVREWFLGADTYMPLEGAPGILFQIGLVGIALMILVCRVPASRSYGWLPPLAGLAAACAVDYSYALFPTLFLPAAMLCSNAISRSGRSDLEPDGTVSRVPLPGAAGERIARRPVDRV